MKKVFSWILSVLSCLLLILFVSAITVSFINSSFDNGAGIALIPIILVLGLSLASGIVARRLAKDKSFPYYLAVPFCFFYLFLYIAMGVKYLIDEMQKKVGFKADEKEEEVPVFIVRDNGYERTLKLFRKYCEDYGAPGTSGIGVYYNRYKDDIGRYWRSYDGDKTFIKEETLRERGWNIDW